MAPPNIFHVISRLRGGDPLPLLCPGEATSGVLSSILGSLAQERPETTGEGLEKGYKDVKETAASFLQGKTKRVGLV